MPITLQITRNEFAIAVKSLQQELSNEVVLDKIGAALLAEHRDRFLSQRGPDGDAWLPSFSAVREGRNTLLDTQALFNSIGLFRKGPGVRSIGVDESVRNPRTGQSAAEYGLLHQFGIGVPKREFIGFAVGDRAVVEAILSAEFNRAARRIR